MTDIMTSQNIDLPSWDILYMYIYTYGVQSTFSYGTVSRFFSYMLNILEGKMQYHCFLTQQEDTMNIIKQMEVAPFRYTSGVSIVR
jgi:hypothetical protein